LVGAAVGAAVTYLLTSRSTRGKITNALEDFGNTLEEEADELSSAAADKVQKATQAAKNAASKIVD